jgi:hypothetical protein
MRLTRWKLMAGALGLSMCGLAALAEPACRSVGLTRRADEPKPADDPKPADGAKPLPLPAAPPPATEVPPPVILPSADPKPSVPPVVESKPVALPAVNDTSLPPAVDPNLFKAVDAIQNPPTPLPTIDPATKLPPPVKAFDTPPPIPVTPPTPPAQAVPPTIDLVPVKNEKPVPVSPLPAPDKKVDLPPAPLTEKKADPLPPSPIVSGPNTIPPPSFTEKPVGVVSKKLKVMLHLSDEKPWFEVKDGEEVVLKVTADAVQLNATAEKSRPAGVLVATGGVTFRTLGGYGTCDELQVMPGTGEVVVTGKVAVTSNWGKSETTATADKMTFRLGGDAKK